MKAIVIAAALLVAVVGSASTGVAQSGGGFKNTGRMASFRVGQTATPLPNGKILIAGGRDNVTPVEFPFDCRSYTDLATTELYDPSTGTFMSSGSMSHARVWHTATLLTDGKVLFVGGDTMNPSEFNDCVALGLTPTAEIYDSSTGRFTTLGNPIEFRSDHTATLLRDGRVLLAGPGQRASLYDPLRQMFLSTGMMMTPRAGHTATLLNDGKVLVTGGYNPDDCAYLDSAELFDPSTGGFTAVAGMLTSRYAHSAVLLSNGTVLITGGLSYTGTLNNAELYDSETRTFAPAGNMNRARSGHSMTPLQNGTVLVVGGDATGRPTAELYDPGDGTFSATTSMKTYRASHSANSLSNGTVLVTGGGSGTYATATDSAEIYDPALLNQAQTPKPRKAARDFNGDGKSDVLWRDKAGNVSMWLLDGDKGGEDRFIANIWPGWTIAGAGDFNGDERSDILWRETHSGQVVIWWMDGSVVSGYREIDTVPAPWAIAGIADFNGDGRSDILWHDPAGKAVMWLMDGFAIVSNVTIGEIGARWLIAGAADFDGDGKDDILWRHQDSGHVAISLMDGPAVSSTLDLGPEPVFKNSTRHEDWIVAGIADFDGDKSADILWRDIEGNVFMWLINGATAVSKWYVDSVWIGWTITGTGNFNGDNLADILWSDTQGNVTIWSMDGIARSGWRSMGNVGDRIAQ